MTFSEPINISENEGGSFDEQIISEGNNVYVVWENGTPDNFEIFFARSTDGGMTFSEPINISDNEGDSSDPQISIEGNNMYVVWLDDTPGNRDIFFASSTDGGLTFSEPINISDNEGESIRPVISSTTSQENPNSEIQMTNPQIQMTNPPQQTVTSAAVTFQQQPPGEDSPIITQGIKGSPTISQEIGNSPKLTALEKQSEDSSELTATEKIIKLKKQWLELLP
jgi:hypothetical protein